jgi:hypothetical protein
MGEVIAGSAGEAGRGAWSVSVAMGSWVVSGQNTLGPVSEWNGSLGNQSSPSGPLVALLWPWMEGVVVVQVVTCLSCG